MTPSTPTPVSSTIADLTAAQLVAYAQQNMPVRPTLAAMPPYDPTNTAAFIKLQNLTHVCDEIYGGTQAGGPDPVASSNQQSLNRFSGLCHVWEVGDDGPPKSTPIPAWPLFQYVDLSLFDQWWAQLQRYYTPGDAHYDDDAFYESLINGQYFRVKAPTLPTVQILPPVAAPTPTALGLGAPIPGVTEPLFAVTGGPAPDTALGTKQVFNGATYTLIDMNPMGGSGDYAWLLIAAAAPVVAPAATAPPAPII